MDNRKKTSKTKQTVFGTIRDDLRQGGFQREVEREFEELKEYMLDQEHRDRLKRMGRGKRWLLMLWWLLKGMFFKLTPVRRLLLVLGIILILHYSQNPNNQGFPLFGGLIVLFVLMLELKDKLLAREELEAGRAVQQALMPECSPAVPGWDVWLFTRSANEVGGDLVDFARPNGNRFGTALGDVAGKGLSAALLMVKLQATLQALIPDTTSLRMLGGKLNRVFCKDCLPSVFASLVYLEFQPDSGTVRILNAGHIPPLAVRGGQAKELAKGGPALGLVPKAVFPEQRVNLQKGDFLLVSSDGITEARNEQGEFFGEQRVSNLMPRLSAGRSESIGKNLVSAVERFIGHAKANDDLSVVVLKRV